MFRAIYWFSSTVMQLHFPFRLLQNVSLSLSLSVLYIHYIPFIPIFYFLLLFIFFYVVVVVVVRQKMIDSDKRKIKKQGISSLHISLYVDERHSDLIKMASSSSWSMLYKFPLYALDFFPHFTSIQK